MKCVFERRISTAATFRKLFSSVNVLYLAGRSASNSGYTSIPGAQITAVTKTAYILSFFNGYLGVWRVVNGAVDPTPIRHDQNQGGLYYRTSSNEFRYYNGNYTSGTGTGTATYGCTLALVEFPGAHIQQVEAVLGSNAFGRLAYRNNSSTATGQVAISTALNYSGVLVAQGDRFDAWAPDGHGSLEYIGGGGTQIAATNTSYLRSQNAAYGYSFVGVV